MHEQQRSQDAEYTSSTEVDPNLYRSEVICRALLIQQIRPRYVLGHAGCIAPTWQRELLPVDTDQGYTCLTRSTAVHHVGMICMVWPRCTIFHLGSSVQRNIYNTSVTGTVVRYYA